MKKAVNPKTNCFVYMDMKLSNCNFVISFFLDTRYILYRE